MNSTSDTKIDVSTAAIPTRGYLKWLVRGACLTAAVAVLYPLPAWPELTVVVPALSPLVALASLLSTWALPAVAGIGLVVCLITVVRRRWFCRWACPTGLCADAASGLGLRLGRKCPRFPPLGHWLVLLTLGGASVGYPVLLWLDPLALFTGAFSLIGPGSRSAASWAAAGLPTLLLLSVLFPRLWCLRLCPLGAMQDIVPTTTSVFRRIRSSDKDSASPVGRVRLARRVVVFGLLGAVWGAAVRKATAATARPLRPPGAIDETKFTGVCIRCGNCTRACPTTIIEPDVGNGGIAGFLTPVLSFEQDYCLEDCTRCTNVCPSGALTSLTPENKGQTPIGFPRIDMDVCLLGDDRECAVCRSHCPFDAITLLFSEESYTLTPQIDMQRCPGCGACEAVCPTQPVKAIIVHPR